MSSSRRLGLIDDDDIPTTVSSSLPVIKIHEFYMSFHQYCIRNTQTLKIIIINGLICFIRLEEIEIV